MGSGAARGAVGPAEGMEKRKGAAGGASAPWSAVDPNAGQDLDGVRASHTVGRLARRRDFFLWTSGLAEVATGGSA